MIREARTQEFDGVEDRDPTPEEIKEEREKIQAGWSETTRRSRMVDERNLDNIPVDVPIVREADIDFAFAWTEGT